MPPSKKYQRKPLVQANSAEEVNTAHKEIKDFDTELGAMAQGIQSWLDSFQKSPQAADDQESTPTEINQSL